MLLFKHFLHTFVLLCGGLRVCVRVQYMFLFLKESVCAFLVFALCKKLLSVIIIMCIISADVDR